jgi:hypothetical protein
MTTSNAAVPGAHVAAERGVVFVVRRNGDTEPVHRCFEEEDNM